MNAKRAWQRKGRLMGGLAVMLWLLLLAIAPNIAVGIATLLSVVLVGLGALHIAGTQRVQRRKLRRRNIPREMRRQAWLGDGGRCARCGSALDIQYDRIISLSRGGSNSVQTLQTLCSRCIYLQRST